MTEIEAASPLLAEMADDAAMIRLLAMFEPDGVSAAALRDQAERIESWRAYMRRLARALDEIAADAAEDALLAEQNPGRGQSPCARRPSTAAGASDPGRGTCLRTIDQVIALAEQDRGSVVRFPRRLCVVPAPGGGEAI